MNNVSRKLLLGLLISISFPIIVWRVLLWQSPSSFQGDFQIIWWLVILAIPVGIFLGIFCALLLPTNKSEDR